MTSQPGSLVSLEADFHQGLDRIDALIKGSPAMEEFLRGFTDIIVKATIARGGAVWFLQGKSHQPVSKASFADCEYETNEVQRESIDSAVEDAARNLRPMVLGPTGREGQFIEALGRKVMNLSPYPFVFVPASTGVITPTEKKLATAVLHIWTLPGQARGRFPELVKFLQAAGSKFAAYVDAKRVESLETASGSLQQLLQLAVQITGEFDLARLGISLANRGREIIGCDRLLVFACDASGQIFPVAASNVDVINPKSSLVQTQVLLVREAVLSARPTLYQKTAPKTEELGDISDYFFHSRADDALALPLKGPDDQMVGALLAEFHAKEMTPQARRLAVAVASQAGRALSGALGIERIPFLGTARKIGQTRERFREQYRKQTLLRFGLPIAAVLVLAFFPLPLSLHSDCVVSPVQQGYAVSEVAGRITKVLAQEGDHVTAGQALATVNDLELRHELAVATEEHARAEAEANRFQAKGDEGGRGVAMIEATRSLRKVDQTRNMLEKTNIRSPIDGVIITKQIQNRAGEVLPVGGRFCEVADLRQWEVLSKLSEGDLGVLDPKLRQDGKISMTFVLQAMPDRHFSALVDKAGGISQSSLPVPGSNVFVVRAPITSPEAVSLLRPGYTGRSKIPIGYRPAGYLAVRKLLAYLKVRWFL